MPQDSSRFNRRSFLKRVTAVSLGAMSARGIYEVIDSFGITPPNRAEAAVVRRKQEQYLIDSLEVILDNNVPVVIPPLYNDVFTAKLAAGRTWNKTTLAAAQSRLENALKYVEGNYPATAAGLTIVVAWGLPYFRNYLPQALWQKYLPVDKTLPSINGQPQYAVLDAIQFPSDPSSVILEQNHLMIKFRSDSQAILQATEKALFDDPTSKAYIGDLFDLTSKRMGFLGRGFNKESIAKQLALSAGIPGADQIPDNAQLMMGFTSTQAAAAGPDNIVSFETLPGVTDQFPAGYFAGGCAMHLSHLYEDLAKWYGSFSYSQRLNRMYSPRTSAPAGTTPVTLSNGPADVSTRNQVIADASTGVLGHNATLQQATRLPADIIDNYGRLRPKGTAVPIREDFNTIDSPFAWSANPTVDNWSSAAAAGLHFVAFVPTSSKFHAARLAMDGILPDGTNLQQTYTITDNGLNSFTTTTHRQNFLIPPRAHRSFPLAELM